MAGLKVRSVLLLILYHFCQRCIPSGISTHVEIGKTCSELIFMSFELLGKRSEFRFGWKAKGGNNVKVTSIQHNLKKT